MATKRTTHRWRGGMEMMHPLFEGLDWLLSYYVNARAWFWLCVVVIVIGLIAVVGNLMEPSRASF